MTTTLLRYTLPITNSDFQVLLRKENMVSAPNVAANEDITANDDIAQQYLGEDVADKNNKL